MGVIISVPAVLFASTEESAAEIELPGGTVGEVLQALIERYPRIEEAIRDSSRIQIFLNDKQIRSGIDDTISVTDGSQIELVPNIAGGR